MTDNYLKYVEDSKKLIDENTKLMKGIYDSDLKPTIQAKKVEGIDATLKSL